jgi:subtilisin family serine protease
MFTDPTPFRPSSLVRIARVAACLALPLAAAAAHAGEPTDPLVPGELMLRAENPKLLASALSTLSASFADVGVLDQIDGRPIYLISYGLTPKQTPDDVDLVIDALVLDTTITWGELNYEGQTGEGRTDSLWLSGLGLGQGHYQSQYARDLLGLDAAHKRSRGAGAIVAVIDTGIDATHPALSGRVSSAGVSFVAGSPSFLDIGDGIDNDGDGLVDEQVGHGTFVAGLISLIAPDAMLLPVRVLDSEGRANNFQLARAVAWSIDRGAHVINMSLGEDYESLTLEDVVLEAAARGIVVVGAAGNRATDDPREYPACNDRAIGVTATGWNDLRAPFSNFDTRMDLAAPGGSVLFGGGADLARSIIGPVPGGEFAVWEGTSLSAAFVSGTAALVRAQHPTWPNASVPAGQVFDAVLATLGGTGAAIDAINPGFEGQLGQSRISASGAVAVGPIAPPRGDINLDGFVGAPDLSALLSGWGPAPGGARADLDADGAVDARDLTILLSVW